MIMTASRLLKHLKSWYGIVGSIIAFATILSQIPQARDNTLHAAGIPTKAEVDSVKNEMLNQQKIMTQQMMFYNGIMKDFILPESLKAKGFDSLQIQMMMKLMFDTTKNSIKDK